MDEKNVLTWFFFFKKGLKKGFGLGIGLAWSWAAEALFRLEVEAQTGSIGEALTSTPDALRQNI